MGNTPSNNCSSKNMEYYRTQLDKCERKSQESIDTPMFDVEDLKVIEEELDELSRQDQRGGNNDYYHKYMKYKDKYLQKKYNKHK